MSIDKLGCTVNIATEEHTSIIDNLNRLHSLSKYKSSKSFQPGYRKSIKFELPSRNMKGLKRVPTSVTISLDPGKRKDKKRPNFARIEYNPSVLSRNGHKRLRNILCTVFNLKDLAKIYYESRITLIDITIDIFNHSPEDFWYMIPRSFCGGIFFNKDGLISTIYTGSNRSKIQLTSYEKMNQLRSKKRILEKVSGMPDTLLRLEATLRDTDYYIFEAPTINNPFGKIQLFKPLNELEGVTTCFFDSVRFRGLKSAMKLLSNEEKKVVKKALKRRCITEFSSDELWLYWEETVNRSLYSIYPKTDYKRFKELFTNHTKKRNKKPKSKSRYGFTRTKF